MSLTLQDIRDRCRIDDGHWLWRGASSNGWPRIWAPDHSKGEGEMSTQTGRRAVWHLKTGKPIAKGWRVFGTCDESLCVNPAHMDCRSVAEEGARVAASGKLKGQIQRIVASRATGRARSNLTPELFQMILVSEKSGVQITRETGVNRTTVSRIRTGQALAFQPVGGLFTGLMR